MRAARRNAVFVLLGSLLISGCRAGSAGSGGSGGGGVPDAGLLVTGGTVVTLDARDGVIPDGAVAIEGGRIVAVGSAKDLLGRYPTLRRLEADGGLILPGLINAHTHAPMVLFRGLADDLKLMEWLEENIFPAEAEHVDEEFVRWGTRLACLEMLRGGITTFVDMYYYENVIAEVAEECGMRAIAGQTLIDFPAPDHATWYEAVEYTRAFVARWQGHSRITPAVAPHAAYTVSGDHLKAAHALAEELETPLLLHLAEDRSEVDSVLERTGLRPVEYLADLGLLTSRLIAAHVVWPSPEEIELLADSGAGVAHCPQSNMKVAAGIAPVPAMSRAGVALGLGTDGAASNNDLNLWEEIDTAAKLHKVATGDSTAMPARTVLRMATIEGARAIGMEEAVGSLEVGKRADLIVVGTDGFHQTPHYAPYSLLAYSTKASDVEAVVVEGRVVVEDGRVLTLDASLVRARVEEYRAKLSPQ